MPSDQIKKTQTANNSLIKSIKFFYSMKVMVCIRYVICSVFIVFFSFSAGAQQVIKFSGIHPDDPNGRQPLRNPERGFRYEAFVLASTLRSPYAAVNKTDTSGNTYGANPDDIDSLLTFLEIRNGAGDSLTLSQLYIYLTPYVGKEITEDGLKNIRAIFKSFEKKGYKAVLRFAYDYNPDLTNVTVTDIQRHMGQLKPLLEEYAGVIHVVQAGLVGAWGEWHDSPIAEHKDSLQIVLQTLFKNIPDSKKLMVRMPAYKNNADLPAAWKARIGFNNDYFCADDHSHALDNDYVKGTPEYWQVLYESPYLLIDGEMPYAEKTEWGLHHKLNVINVLKRLREHHYTSFSVVHNNLENDSSNIRYWRSYQLAEKEIIKAKLPLSDGYFRDKKNNLVKRTAFEYIRDHLGYRLEIQSLTLPHYFERNQDLVMQLSLINRGFSAPHNAREVYFVLINEKGNVSATIPIYARPDTWQPFLPGDTLYKPIMYTMTARYQNGKTLAPGKYKVGLWLSDGSMELKMNPAYAIRCANSNNYWWVNAEQQYGINILSEITVR